jgi:hypothetical protein
MKPQPPSIPATFFREGFAPRRFAMAGRFCLRPVFSPLILEQQN